MLYELRVYNAAPGKMTELLNRFEHNTFHFFEKHGMKLEGFWYSEVGENSHNQLLYVLSFNDYDHMEKAWKSMLADEEWLKVKTLTEKDGPLVTNVNRSILRKPAFVKQI